MITAGRAGAMRTGSAIVMITTGHAEATSVIMPAGRSLGRVSARPTVIMPGDLSAALAPP